MRIVTVLTIIASAVALGLTVGASSATTATLIRTQVVGTTSADVFGLKKTVKKPTFRRVRLAVTDIVATVQPWTYDDAYARVLGVPYETPATISIGSLMITCKRSKPFDVGFTSKSFTATGVTIPLPVRKATSCSISVSASVSPPALGIYSDVTNVRATITVTSTK